MAAMNQTFYGTPTFGGSAATASYMVEFGTFREAGINKGHLKTAITASGGQPVEAYLSNPSSECAPYIDFSTTVDDYGNTILDVKRNSYYTATDPSSTFISITLKAPAVGTLWAETYANIYIGFSKNTDPKIGYTGLQWAYDNPYPYDLYYENSSYSAEITCGVSSYKYLQKGVISASGGKGYRQVSVAKNSSSNTYNTKFTLTTSYYNNDPFGSPGVVYIGGQFTNSANTSTVYTYYDTIEIPVTMTKGRQTPTFNNNASTLFASKTFYLSQAAYSESNQCSLKFAVSTSCGNACYGSLSGTTAPIYYDVINTYDGYGSTVIEFRPKRAASGRSDTAFISMCAGRGYVGVNFRITLATASSGATAGVVSVQTCPESIEIGNSDDLVLNGGSTYNQYYANEHITMSGEGALYSTLVDKSTSSADQTKTITISNTAPKDCDLKIHIFSTSSSSVWTKSLSDITIRLEAGTNTRVYLQNEWKKAQPKVYYNGAWRDATTYVYTGSEWKKA